MKLDAQQLRYLTSDDFRVLTATEMGSKNHEIVPTQLITHIAKTQTNKILRNLTRLNLVARLNNAKYDGYRLTYGGYDYLALHSFLKRDVVIGVGRQIGVGKESDVYLVVDNDYEEHILKIHRLGRTSFRTVKANRDYMGKRKHASWMYMSRLAAAREFAFMKIIVALILILYEHGFRVPKPIDVNRHCIVMEYIKGTPLCQVDEVEDPKKLYHTLMNMIVDLAQVGLIHSDFNEFNLVLTDEDEPVLIDFPQMVSTSHQNADMYFDRDVQCIVRFFGKRFQYEDEFVPKFEDIVRKGKLDVDVEASGFMKKLQKEFKQFDAEIDDNFDEEGDSENHSEDGEDSLSHNDEKSDSEEKNEALVEDLEKLNFEDDNEQHEEEEESKITSRLSYEEVKKIVAKRIVQQSAKQVTNLARKAKHAKGVKKIALSPKDYVF